MGISGVRPIPAFEAPVRLALDAAWAAVRAATESRDTRSQGKMAKLATSLSNLAVAEVEQVLGPLDPDRAVVFFGDDGGVVLSASGKPPIPFPWPAQELAAKDYVARGLVQQDLVDVVQQAAAANMPLLDVFESPAAIAAQLKLPLSDKSAKELQMLAPSRLDQIKDPLDREITAFFQKVVADGRYIGSWQKRPYEVVKQLKLTISDEALERLASGGAPTVFLNQAPSLHPVIIVAAAIVVIIGITVVLTRDSIQVPVNDRSGKSKV
jgi:hypothetical protein